MLISDSDDDDNVAGDHDDDAAGLPDHDDDAAGLPDHDDDAAGLPDAQPAGKSTHSGRALPAPRRDSPLQHNAQAARAARRPESQSLHISLLCTDSEDDDDDDDGDNDGYGGGGGGGGYTGPNDDDDGAAFRSSDGDSDQAGESENAGPASLLAFNDDNLLSVDDDSPVKKPARKKPRKGPMDPALKAQKEAERLRLKQAKASEKERLKREKTAAREVAKKEKELGTAREKAERVAERSKLRTRTSVERMEELVMTVTQDIDLLLMKDEEIFKKLCDSRIKIEKVAGPTDGGYNVIRWQRKIPRTKFEEIGTHDLVDERFTMVLLDALTFLELLASDELVERVERIQRTFPADYEVTIVVEGLEKFFRSQSTKENKAYRQRVISLSEPTAGGAGKGKATRKHGHLNPKIAELNPMAVEMGLVDLQMESSVRIRLSTGPKETARHVYMYAKAVASAPDKQQYMGFGFCTHTRAPERVDRNGYKGLRRLWLRHLQQFSGISEFKAQAIVDAYPSPQALIKAFREAGKHAIQNVGVRRGEAVRRIGPKASELMHKFFTSQDAAVMLE